jgi:hypothetical protein
MREADGSALHCEIIDILLSYNVVRVCVCVFLELSLSIRRITHGSLRWLGNENGTFPVLAKRTIGSESTCLTG